MIRELKLLCSECGKEFSARNKLYYKDTFQSKDFSDFKLICPACHKKWQDYWSVEDARFFEEYGSLYVDIVLKNKDKYEKMDCTAMDDIVATSTDIPLKAQKTLYNIYKKWYDIKMKDCLKSCDFKESFMKTTFTCETYGGDKYTDIAFRFNRMGALETESEIPDIIKNQIMEKWDAYELMNTPFPKTE